MVTVTLTGGRTLWLVAGFAAATEATGVFPVITFNPGDVTTTASLSAVSVATSGLFRTAALLAETAFGYFKSAASVPGAAGSRCDFKRCRSGVRGYGLPRRPGQP